MVRRIKGADSYPLLQINSGVFMKVNSASVNNLRLAGAYVTYGSPNVKTVRCPVHAAPCCAL
jgi:hypothetical protein